MSCLIMSPEAHAALANTLAGILNHGFNRFGFSAPDSLCRELADCSSAGYYHADRIFSRLYRLNARAYAHRYNEHPELVDLVPVPRMPSVPDLAEPRRCDNWHEKLFPWHYRFAKLLDCLIYQAEEDATRTDPLLLALIDLSHIYTAFLVHNTDDYANAPWGTL